MNKTPLQTVREVHGTKEKLVEEVLQATRRPSDLTKDVLKKKLKTQSNRKLLVLLAREAKIRDRFGSRDSLIDAIAKAKMGNKRKEDKDYRKYLSSLTSGQLLDLAHRCGLQT